MFEHQELVHPTIPVSRNKKKKQRPINNRRRHEIPNATDIGSRDVFADWLTSPENPRFSMVIANRLWKQTMGLGLIEPLDDITDDTEASNPELLDYLTQQMVSLDYDLKQFYRVIYNSKTYQCESEDVDVADASTYYFPGPLLRRMTAEQLWDSFLTLAVPDLDSRENPRNKMTRYGIGSDIYESFEMAQNMSVDDVLKLAEKELAMRNDPAKRRERFKQMMQENDSTKTKYAKHADQLKGELNRLKDALRNEHESKSDLPSFAC